MDQWPRRLGVCLLCICLTGLAACGAAPAPAARPVMAEPAEIVGVKNFARVSDHLYRGAQPTREGFAELKRRGIKTIINARSTHSDRKEIKGLGFRYVHIYCEATHPEDEDALAFLKVVQDPANHPVFVHCQRGADRTGYLVAVYRRMEQAWSPAAAAAEMKVFHFNTIFTEITKYLRKFDVQRFGQKLAQAKGPKVEVVE